MFTKCTYKSIRHRACLNIHIRQIKGVQTHGEWRTKGKDSNVKYKIKCHLAEGGEREQWSWFVSCEKKLLLFTEKTREWRICPNPDIKTRITASFAPFQVFFLEKCYSNLSHCRASLHCGWDTVAAPVADVSGKRRHAISLPIGHSPLHAIIEWCCAWKKMIMGALNSVQQLTVSAIYHDWTTSSYSSCLFSTYLNTTYMQESQTQTVCVC